MIVTPLKLYHVPAGSPGDKHVLVMGLHRMYAVREHIARVQGKSFDPQHQVFYALTPADNPPPSKATAITITTGSFPMEYPCREALMRRFHFFDDFFSSFPDAVTVHLPFRFCLVRAALYLEEMDDGLTELLECMKYLNPKSPDEYFQMIHTGEMTDSFLLDLIEDLDDEHIADMVEARGS